jgi:uncharacterized protein (UPF0261 family)
MPTILLIGTLDTKGDEYAYVAELIRARGAEVLVMDVGVFEAPARLPDTDPEPLVADIVPTVVAREGHSSIAELRAGNDRGKAMEVMSSGAASITAQLYRDRKFDGVLGLGGGGGTTVISAAMRELPVGVPKVLVSTMASGNTSPYIDVKDITMMYPVVDIAGLNPLSRRILANAAGAIVGMVTMPVDRDEREELRPVIAATMFGVTTPCVTAARKRLEGVGYDVLVFHATGSGGRAMEGLIDDGYIDAVLDVTTTEWCDEVVGGTLTAGPDRLTAAGRRGIPQVVSVGALDMVNFGAFDTVPPQFASRDFYRHNATVTLMRTTPEECREIGMRIALQLSKAHGPVTLMLPLRGVSMIDADGQPFYNPAANKALFDSLREHCSSHVRIVELDLHINDPAFADALAEELLSMLA